MVRIEVGKLTMMVAVLGCLSLGLTGVVGLPGTVGTAIADELNVEGLPADPAAYKKSVDQILAKVTSMVAKLKDKKEAFPVVLDLMMTRDNVMREILKAEATPDGSKWTNKEGRASVDAMLRLLKVQYEKASGMAG